MTEVRQPISELVGKRIRAIETYTHKGGNTYYRFWFSKTHFIDVDKENLFDWDGMYFEDDTGK